MNNKSDISTNLNYIKSELQTYTENFNHFLPNLQNLSNYSPEDLHLILQVLSNIKSNIFVLSEKTKSIHSHVNEQLQNICKHNYVRDRGNADPCRTYEICSNCDKYR